jgi:hypothetical protein
MEVNVNYEGEVAIVGDVVEKTPNGGGEPFSVCRAAVSRMVPDRELQASIRRTTYIGLIARGQTADLLHTCGVGEKVHVTGELWLDEFTHKDGNAGRDRKLTLATLRKVQVGAANVVAGLQVASH